MSFKRAERRSFGYYLRRLLLMRWRDGDKAGFAQHLDRLRTRGAAVGWFDFADALVDWAVLAVTGRGVVINGHAARGRLFASLRNSSLTFSRFRRLSTKNLEPIDLSL